MKHNSKGTKTVPTSQAYVVPTLPTEANPTGETPSFVVHLDQLKKITAFMMSYEAAVRKSELSGESFDHFQLGYISCIAREALQEALGWVIFEDRYESPLTDAVQDNLDVIYDNYFTKSGHSMLNHLDDHKAIEAEVNPFFSFILEAREQAAALAIKAGTIYDEAEERREKNK